MAEIIAEGKTKVIIDIGNGMVIIRSKNAITAGDGAKKNEIPDKGAKSTQMNCNIFELLKRKGVPTHFVGRVYDENGVVSNEFTARKCAMLPLEFILRKKALGSYLERHPDVVKGTLFEVPVFDITDKEDKVHDPIVYFDFESGYVTRYNHSKPKEDPSAFIDSVKIADSRFAGYSPELLAKCEAITLQVFSILGDAFETVGGDLLDFKIELGFDEVTGELLVADVIDCDSCRIEFDGEQRDKQAYREGTKSLDELLDDFAFVAEKTDHFKDIL